MYAPTNQRTLRTDSTHQTQKDAKKSYKIFMTLWFQISSPQIWGKCIYFVIEFVPLYQNNLRKLIQPGSRTPGVLVKCHSENPNLLSQPLWAWSHRIRFSKLSTHAFNEISNWESTGPGDSLRYLGEKKTWNLPGNSNPIEDAPSGLHEGSVTLALLCRSQREFLQWRNESAISKILVSVHPYVFWKHHTGKDPKSSIFSQKGDFFLHNLTNNEIFFSNLFLLYNFLCRFLLSHLISVFFPLYLIQLLPTRRLKIYVLYILISEFHNLDPADHTQTSSFWGLILCLLNIFGDSLGWQRLNTIGVMGKADLVYPSPNPNM